MEKPVSSSVDADRGLPCGGRACPVCPASRREERRRFRGGTAACGCRSYRRRAGSRSAGCDRLPGMSGSPCYTVLSRKSCEARPDLHADDWGRSGVRCLFIGLISYPSVGNADVARGQPGANSAPAACPCAQPLHDATDPRRRHGLARDACVVTCARSEMLIMQLPRRSSSLTSLIIYFFCSTSCLEGGVRVASQPGLRSRRSGGGYDEHYFDKHPR